MYNVINKFQGLWGFPCTRSPQGTKSIPSAAPLALGRPDGTATHTDTSENRLQPGSDRSSTALAGAHAALTPGRAPQNQGRLPLLVCPARAGALRRHGPLRRFSPHHESLPRCLHLIPISLWLKSWPSFNIYMLENEYRPFCFLMKGDNTIYQVVLGKKEMKKKTKPESDQV